MEAHASRIATGKPFAISVKTMAAARTAAPLGVARMRAARDCLIAADVLRVVHTGGRCPGDVSLYRFGELA